MPHGLGVTDKNITPQFREVVGFPGYVVSSEGEVLSFRGGKFAKILGIRLTNSGYFNVSLRTDFGETIQKRVHHIVLEAFVGPKKAGCVTRHLNNNKLDNRLCNLAWGTYLENTQDRIEAGTHYVFPYANGDRVGTAKLNVAKVLEIRASDLPAHRLASIMGVGKTTIHRVRHRQTWAHVNPVS